MLEFVTFTLPIRSPFAYSIFDKIQSPTNPLSIYTQIEIVKLESPWREAETVLTVPSARPCADLLL